MFSFRLSHLGGPRFGEGSFFSANGIVKVAMSSILPRTYKLRLEDEAKFKHIEQEQPEWLLSEDCPQFTPRYLEKIGIQFGEPLEGNGYIKLLYRDFIVEELTLDGRVVTIVPQDDASLSGKTAKIPKVRFDLVKQGLATFEAIELLADALGIPMDSVHYAGLKDSKAITAQEIIINNLTPDKLQGLSVPNLFLKNVRDGDTILNAGNLYGNRFTILVRTDGVERSQLFRRVDTLATKGFYNFFSLQRFGQRLQAHSFGRSIMQGDYEGAVKGFLTGESTHESRLMQHYRAQARDAWGNWDKLRDIFDTFPYFFYNERLAVASLQEKPGDFIAALNSVPDQAKIWMNAYFSDCFNKLLSRCIRQGNVPDSLPLLRQDRDSQELYASVVSPKEIASLRFRQPEIPSLVIRAQSIPTRVLPLVHSVVPTDVGFIFHFDLHKGAYATTFLSQVVSLYEKKPVPEWVKPDSYDTRKRIGYPPVMETEDHFPKQVLEVSDFE